MNIEVNTVTLNYEKSGSGYPLLLLHGNGEDHTIFNPLIVKLANYFTVYAIDSRNHGLSSQTKDFSYEAMAQDISDFINVLDLKKPAIIGFSDGAIIATMIELKRPNTFSKMALLGLNLKPSDFKEENLAYLNEEYAKTQDPLIELMLKHPSIEVEELQTIKTPCLLIWGEDDLYNDSLYEKISKAIPQSKLVIMKGQNHDSYVVGVDTLYDQLVDFLNYTCS